MSKAGGAAPALLVLASIFAGCTAPIRTLEIPVPSFSAGDHWEFEYSNLTTTSRSTIFIDAVSFGDDFRNTSVQHFAERQVSANETAVVEHQWRASDGAEFYIYHHNTYNQDGTKLHFMVDSGDQPCPSYFGTHAIGRAWTVSCEIAIFGVNDTNLQERRQLGPAQSWNQTFQVLGRQPMTVNGTAYNAWHIRYESEGRTAELWYSSELCREIKRVDEELTMTMLSGHCRAGRPLP